MKLYTVSGIKYQVIPSLWVTLPGQKYVDICVYVVVFLLLQLSFSFNCNICWSPKTRYF